MLRLTINFLCACFLSCAAAQAQDKGRVQPKFKTVYLPTKRINQALQNAFVIDSLTKRSDSLSTVNAGLLGKIYEKENLLNELISLADSEAAVINKAQLQISALEFKNNEAKSTSNLLLVIAIFSSICAIVFLILMLTRKKSGAQTAGLNMAQAIKMENKVTEPQIKIPVSAQYNQVPVEPIDISLKRDPLHTVIQLERLAKMLEMGILTQEEFASQKRDVLKGN